MPLRDTEYVKAVASGLTEGLLIAPDVPASYLKALREHNIPYVLIDEAADAYRSSIVDATNWQGGYEATRHQAALGHSRIAFIAGLMDIRSAFDRMVG